MEKEAFTPKGRRAPWRHRVVRVDETGRRNDLKIRQCDIHVRSSLKVDLISRILRK